MINIRHFWQIVKRIWFLLEHGCPCAVVDNQAIPCYAGFSQSEGDIMKLYLVRHGEAKSRGEDPKRPLTEHGRKDVTKVAAFARRAGVEVAQIRHSGKLRAAETADILAEHLEPADGVVVMPALDPDEEVHAMAALLEGEAEPLMLVGHLPFLERLAALLIVGDASRTVVVLPMAGMVCLDQLPTTRTWSVRWDVTPDLLP
jgi:phosphohistidine phosphatase